MTIPSTIPLPRITWRGFALAALVWLLYTVVFSAYFSYTMSTPFLPNLPITIRNYTITALYSIPVWLLVVRRMDRAAWSWKLAAHIIICPVYVFFSYQTPLAISYLQYSRETVQEALQKQNDLLKWQVLGLVFTYLLQFSIYHIVRSAQRLRWREQQTAELLALTREQELAILKAQLNPHFLFNTLNSISAMVTRDPEETRRMIARLSDLLRYAVDSAKNPLVPLADEWEFTRAYLELEQQRLVHRLRVETAIIPEALELYIPPMILQPLVENAIKHGIAPSTIGGELHIEISVNQQSLHISVRDTGMGTNGLTADELKERGTGLQNVESRLLNLFGNSASLRLESPSSGGFQVRVTVPVLEGEEWNNP